MKYLSLAILFIVSCASHTDVKSENKAPSSKKIRLAVTVDDLPEHGPLPAGKTKMDVVRQMVEAFKKNSVPEVYGFVNADRTDLDKGSIEVLKFWVDSGHPLGNHTYSHKSLNKVSSDEFKHEIDRNEKILESVDQKFDWKWFRYPYTEEGDTLEKRNAVREHLKSKGYKIAEVTVNPKDWAWSDPYVRCKAKNNQTEIEWLKKVYLENALDQLNRAKQISKTVFNRQVAHVLVLHIGAFGAEMLDSLLQLYKKEGVLFIPLTEANKDPAYEIDPGVADEWGTSFLLQMMDFKNVDMDDTGLPSRETFNKDLLASVCL